MVAVSTVTDDVVRMRTPAVMKTTVDALVMIRHRAFFPIGFFKAKFPTGFFQSHISHRLFSKPHFPPAFFKATFFLPAFFKATNIDATLKKREDRLNYW